MAEHTSTVVKHVAERLAADEISAASVYRPSDESAAMGLDQCLNLVSIFAVLASTGSFPNISGTL